MRLLILLLFALPCKAQYLFPDSLLKLFKDPGPINKLHRDSTSAATKSYYSTRDGKSQFVLHLSARGKLVELEYRVKDAALYKQWFQQLTNLGLIADVSYIGPNDEIFDR